MKDRINQAVENFLSGYNCSQSVFLAFADLYNIDKETALHMSASFGAGIGRMRMTCGAACGMFMLAGFEKAAMKGEDKAAKSANYKLVQELAHRFKEENGSLICAELLGLGKNPTITSNAETRTKDYYKKRPCPRMVECAARIFSEYLENKEQKDDL
nr:C_GCAxxG_C_C family protein [Prevotella sp.]